MVASQRLWLVHELGDRQDRFQVLMLKLSFFVASLSSMEITRLSDEGQVTIPETLRTAHRWEAGQELVAIDVGDGILQKPKKPFAETTLAQVAGCLRYQGNPKSLDELDDAIRQGIMERANFIT
ncbi:AbrB/MazE/SpoVT family DNA-binding domain-containing protein [Oscillatoria sp. FACHB-1407]|nr:AbrB/MazE/SpoVT family DNA-binding domain-containing protein [Oscillatoria sp. FACHB-1407]